MGSLLEGASASFSIVENLAVLLRYFHLRRILQKRRLRDERKSTGSEDNVKGTKVLDAESLQELLRYDIVADFRVWLRLQPSCCSLCASRVLLTIRFPRSTEGCAGKLLLLNFLSRSFPP